VTTLNTADTVSGI